MRIKCVQEIQIQSKIVTYTEGNTSLEINTVDGIIYE